MESSETTKRKSPVVERVTDRISSLYEKYARIPVSDEVVKSFDRVAKTFQSEKGKKIMESIRPIVPTLAKFGEGVSAVADLSCGVIGMGLGVKEVVDLRRNIINTPDRSAATLWSLFYKQAGVGVAKTVGIPAVFAALRPFSRGALFGARGVGSLGEFVGKTVDQMLMRHQIKQR